MTHPHTSYCLTLLASAIAANVVGGFSWMPAATAQVRSTEPPSNLSSNVIAEATQPDRSNDRATAADRLFKLGVEQVERNENDAALASLQQALTIYQTTGNRSGQMDALRYMGLAYHQSTQYYKALKHFQQSLTISQEIKSRQGEAKALIGSGAVYSSTKESDRAIADYEQARAIAIEIQDRKLEALILENMHRLFNGADVRQKPIEIWQRNLAIYRERNNKTGELFSLVALSLIHYDLKDYQKSIELHRQSLSIANELKSHNAKDAREANSTPTIRIEDLYAKSLVEGGFNWCNQGLDKLEQGLGKIQNPLEKISLLGVLSHCYEKTAQLPKAITYKQQGLLIAQQNQLRLHEGLMLVDLGQSYRLQNDLVAARKSIEQGLVILHEIKDPQWEVFSLDRLSLIYAALAEHRLAIEAQTQRILLAQRYNIRVVKRGIKLAAIQDMKKLGAAQSLHQQYMKDYTWYAQKLQAGGFDANRFNLSESNISDFSGYIRDAFTSLGDAYYQMQDYPRALEFYQSVLVRNSDQDNAYGSVDVDILSRLGRTLAKVGRLSESESMLRLALKYDETFRFSAYGQNSSASDTERDADRIFFAERKIENFQQLQQVLVRQNRTEAALVVAEEARARTFVELLSARRNSQRVPDGKNLPPAPKLDEIRQIAKAQNATLVEYSVVGPNLLYSWVIKPTGEVTFHATQLDPQQPLKRLVASSRSEMGVRGRLAISKIDRTDDDQANPPSALQGNLAKLHQLLIDPIAPDLPTDPNQRVIFLPQGELFLVPFAALTNAQGQYLIERHTIVTAPSIQTLALTHKQAQKAKAIGRSVVIGDPTMPIFEGTALRPLPGARQEAIAIAKLLNTSPLLGEQATKAAVLAQIQSAHVIHFATHGLLDTVQGDMPGAIALAPSGTDSGLLSASEIFDLKLTAQLVVLSACDTGRGKITGDGVVGLSRSLVAAGAPSVLVSLWAVDDGSTRYLMSEFYRHLDQHPDKAQALRNAMLSTMKQYPNPSDWAAFTLIGESN
jgi:CHAT domain-containing protein